MSDETDENLMLQYRDGDAAAFEIVYQRHKGSLYRYMSRLCNAAPVLDELYQEVWLSVIKTRERYQPVAKFKTYLYQIAHNRVIDYFRHSRVEPMDHNDDGAELDQIEQQVNPDPLRILQNQDAMDKFFQILEALPSGQRDVFLLKEEAGLTLPEIAEVTQQNLEAVKSRLRYALAKLRSGLREFSQ